MTGPGGVADLDPAMIRAAHVDSEKALCLLARRDPNAFMEYVLRDEHTGEPIAQAPIHESWQDNANQHDRVVIWSHTEAGKTSQLSIGRVLYEIGRSPNIRVAVISNTHDQAAKIVRAIAKYLESSAEFKDVFPGIERSEPWTSSQLFIRRQVTSKDPTIQACGVHGNITGARIDLLILDDILDFENCRTPGLRQDLWDWYHATLAGRLTKGARVICVGTAYHPDDFLHRLARQPGWAAFRYPVIDDVTGESRWPDRWPLARIEKRRLELGPLEFARQMLCQARDDKESRFKKEWIDKALERGKDVKLIPMFEDGVAGRVYTGVDLAVQRHQAAGRTVLFSILVNQTQDRQLLWIDSGKWTGPEIVDRIIDAHRRWGAIIIVENNAAQDFILQFTRGRSAVPVRPFTTGRNKANPEFGIESLATEMANGKWIIPNDNGTLHPEVSAWITEMLYYDPTAHTGDRLMASWFAREGTRSGARKAETGRLNLTAR